MNPRESIAAISDYHLDGPFRSLPKIWGRLISEGGYALPEERAELHLTAETLERWEAMDGLAELAAEVVRIARMAGRLGVPCPPEACWPHEYDERRLSVSAQALAELIGEVTPDYPSPLDDYGRPARSCVIRACRALSAWTSALVETRRAVAA